jgi:outer membrane protein assembly factor BamB
MTLSMAVSNVPVQAENWPEFRGPTGQGHSTAKGLPLRWSTTENVRWKVDIQGKGWSSPIVVRGRIYLTTAVSRKTGNGNNQSLRALCLDAASGITRWDVEVFVQDGEAAERIHRENSHASPTPVSDGKHLFVHFGTHGTACLTLDGEIVWKTRELKYNQRHGNGGSPVLVDDVLVVSCDGADVQFVVALDRKNGRIRWKKDRPQTEQTRTKFAFSTPLVIRVNGKKQIISTGAYLVVAYDPSDGREIWLVRHNGYSVVPRPVFGHGLVYISTSFTRASLLAIRPDGHGDVTDTHVAWRISNAAPHTPSMLLVGRELYFITDGGGVASCVDAVTGKVHWSKRIGGNYWASPLFADGKIYFQSKQGDTTVIKPGTEFVELARNGLNAVTFASYAVADSALLIRTDRHLYRIQN